MKRTFFLLLLFVQCSLWAQETFVYRPVFINPCTGDTNAYYNRKAWFLVSSNGDTIKPQNEQAVLQRKADYTFFSWITNSKGIPLGLKDSLVVDTFFLSSLKRIFKRHGGEPGYKNCDGPLNGKFIEYYKNGQLKYYGNFEHGEVKDTFLTYFPDGRIQSEKYITKKRKIAKSFSKEGKLLVDHDTRKRFSYWYYDNGVVETRQNNWRTASKEYYPDGKLETSSTKRKECEYHENGSLKNKLTKRGFLFKKVLRRKIKVKYEHYDSLGLLQARVCVKTVSDKNLTDFKRKIIVFRHSIILQKVEIFSQGKRKYLAKAFYVVKKFKQLSYLELYHYEKGKILKKEKIDYLQMENLPIEMKELLFVL